MVINTQITPVAKACSPHVQLMTSRLLCSCMQASTGCATSEKVPTLACAELAVDVCRKALGDLADVCQPAGAAPAANLVRG
jgi:hypothetical protein